MKKTLAAIVLATATLLTGCGGSDNVNLVDTLRVEGAIVDPANGNDAVASINGLPFRTVQAAIAASGVGGRVNLSPGNYTGAVNLLDGQILTGFENQALPILVGPVTMADGNTLNLLRIDGTNGDAVLATNRNNGNITNCEIANNSNAGDGICAEFVSGTWNISNNTISNIAAGGIGIDLTTDGSNVAVARVNDNTISNTGSSCIGFIAADNSQLDIQASGNAMTQAGIPTTFEAVSFGTSTLCLDMENNSVDGVYAFDRNATATLQVEELAAGNGFAGNTGTIENGFVFTAGDSVADGACGF